MRIEMAQRTDLLLRIHLVDANDEPVPLDGATVDFIAGGNCGRVLIQKQGEIIGDGDHVAVALTHEDSDIPPGVYTAELRLADFAGGRFQAGKGLLVITPSMFQGVDNDG